MQFSLVYDPYFQIIELYPIRTRMKLCRLRRTIRMRFGLDEARSNKASQSENAIQDYCWTAKCHSERDKTEQQAESSNMKD